MQDKYNMNSWLASDGYAKKLDEVRTYTNNINKLQPIDKSIYQKSNKERKDLNSIKSKYKQMINTISSDHLRNEMVKVVVNAKINWGSAKISFVK